MWDEECMNRSSFKGEANKPRHETSADNGARCAPGSHEFERIQEPVSGYDFGCINCGLGVQDDA